MRWLLLSAALGLLLGGGISACYETTTGPGPSCAANPYQDGCLPPIHDQRAPDGGR
jgi:hypothetical protein